jgi:hypothetical protein
MREILKIRPSVVPKTDSAGLTRRSVINVGPASAFGLPSGATRERNIGPF